MAELKTKLTDASVEAFLNTLEDESKRQDSFAVVEMMSEATGSDAKMWGSNIIGFGEQRIKYESGRELDWMLIGFSPRKQNLTLYGLNSAEEHDALLAKLGKHTTGKGCLYIKKLKDGDQSVLRELITQSVEHIRTSKP